MPAVSSAYNIEDQERMSGAKNYFAWQNRIISRELGGRVLEVGCGIGNFTETILDRQAIMAIDVDPNCVARLRNRFGDCANLQTNLCDVSTDDFLELRKFRPDTCVMLNVLEHIEHDRSALGRMASVLEPGGVIVLLVPAFSFLYGPIDRNLGHHRRYTPRSLRELAQSLDLRLVRMRFMNFAGFFAWWVNARVLKLEAQSPRQIGIFDRWLAPAISGVEELVHLPFGQSLLAVLGVS